MDQDGTPEDPNHEATPFDGETAADDETVEDHTVGEDTAEPEPSGEPYSVWKSPPPPWMWLFAGVFTFSLIALVIGLLISVNSVDDSMGKKEKGPAPQPSIVEGVAIPGLAAAPGQPYVVGRDTAATTVVVYEDLSCVACRQFHQAADKVLDAAAQAGNAKVERYVVAMGGEGSSAAANALACAIEENIYEEYLDGLYLNQAELPEDSGFTDALLIEIAELSHADDINNFTQCLTERRYSEYVDSVTMQVEKAELLSLPYVVVNGTVVDLRAITYAEFTALVNGANGAELNSETATP